ncbi:hypothetical protein Dxin01_00970 [Deinococcus xinjiangensis]|uniref:N-acetyltransferase domain-containing protein n=1 Tax=Deinococcus xinjiangensis TaxID=457454 RepID=A0ABP9V7I2_9DEIO
MERRGVLELRPEQANWTHTPAELLPEIAGNPKRRGVTVLLGSVPIGFFVLGNDERVEWYAGQPDPAAVTLNGLSLDRHTQGQGLGKQVMAQLPALVGALFPAARNAAGHGFGAAVPASHLAGGFHKSAVVLYSRLLSRLVPEASG